MGSEPGREVQVCRGDSWLVREIRGLGGHAGVLGRDVACIGRDGALGAIFFVRVAGGLLRHAEGFEGRA